MKNLFISLIGLLLANSGYGACFNVRSVSALHFPMLYQQNAIHYIGPGQPGAAALELSAKPNTKLQIKLNHKQVTLYNRVDQHNHMKIQNFRFSQHIKPDSAFNIPNNGRLRLNLGASIQTQLNNLAGAYSGHITLIASCVTQPQTQVINIPVQARVQQRLSITILRNLDFGDVIEGQSSNIVVNPSAANSALIRVTGAPKSFVKVTLAEPSVNAYNSEQPKQTIKLDALHFAGLSNTQTAKLNNQGQLQLTLGATAHISANALPGSYHGKITVHVFYA